MIDLLKRIGAPLAVLILALNLAGCGVNTIPTQEERARAAWSEVLNQYQRRNDLIPNLVETVKGYAQQERDVFIQVTEARAKATQIKIDPSILTDPEAFKRFQEVQAQLSGALARLLAVSERYPDLKSSQNFLTLQAQLEGTENRVAVARRDYIEAVRAYNTELKTFPGVIWANVLYRNNKPMETFTIDQPAMRPPAVNFDRK
jgi:LemA protein